MEERGQNMEQSLSGKPPPYGNTKSNSLEHLVEGKQGRRGADYREQGDKDHLYEEPITFTITRKKGVGNPAYDGDGTQLQMSTFKPDSLGDREFIGRPTTLESSMIKKVMQFDDKHKFIRFFLCARDSGIAKGQTMQAAVRNLFQLLKNEIGERSTLFLTEFYQKSIWAISTRDKCKLLFE